MKGTLQRIKPLHPEMIPPAGAEPFGMTPDRKQLFREVIKRSRPIRDIDPATNEQRWRKNQMTGEPLYRINRPQLYDEERIYYLESEGNGNIRRVDWAPPSEREVAQAERRLRVEGMKDRIAEALVDADMDPDELLAGLRAQRAAPVPLPPTDSVPSADPSPDVETFPMMYAPSRWRLSNGATFRGTKEKAIEAEAAITPEERAAMAEAKAVAALTPEE